MLAAAASLAVGPSDATRATGKDWTKARRYADPAVLEALPFGTRSHWLQPWRVSKTVPSTALSRGIGAVFDNIDLATIPEALETLAESGMGTCRIELGWGNVDFETETRFINETKLRRVFAACRRTGIRPLILLNANHGRPAPAIVADALLIEPAAPGDRSVVVEAMTEIVPNRTGISNLTDRKMAEIFVTAVEGHTRLHLSKPMPVERAAGQRIELATLRYEPFSKPGTTRNEATIAGWLRYVDLVADFAAKLLASSSTADLGFDLEIWNELTFGSNFLSLSNYYEPLPDDLRCREDAIWDEIARRTAAHAEAASGQFAGVSITNGFGNTVPWIASSRQHPRISAISKHPYPPAVRFPGDAKAGIKALGPDGKPTEFEPDYKAFFPEYEATAIQTETLMRDIAPGPNYVYDIAHGTMARSVADRASPVDIWLTEIGVSPAALGIVDPGMALRLKTVFCLRSALFYIGIGAKRVYLFNAAGNPDEHALLASSAPMVLTPPLRALMRALEFCRGPTTLGNPDAPLREISFRVEPSAADVVPIFAGGGHPLTPPLRPSDCLALLPFQSDNGRLAIVYYVMTRDIRVPRAADVMRIQVNGIAGNKARIESFDPVELRIVPSIVEQRSQDHAVLRIEASDSPRVLVVEDA